MSTLNPDPLLTADDVAEYLGVSLRFVRHEIAAGSLPAVRLGSLVKVRRSAVEAYLSANTTAANS